MDFEYFECLLMVFECFEMKTKSIRIFCNVTCMTQSSGGTLSTWSSQKDDLGELGKLGGLGILYSEYSGHSECSEESEYS